MFTRRGFDWTGAFSTVAEPLSDLEARSAYLDGEIAVIDDDGVTSFAALQGALSRLRQRLPYVPCL